ncbi:MAG: hypothetical protein GF387_02195 [Candidatus Portnoybacteria bacterium]|nr:hypothetical protein [Candidatus Portnoybacteria bacterium]
MSSKWTIQDWTTGELNALVKNLGGNKVARKIQRGEVKISFEDIVKTLFDKHGRRIPKNLQAYVCDASRDFRLNQPKLDEEVDFANRITRLHGCLSINTGVTAEQLKAETERLLAMIRENSQIANIANGVCLPVVLPKLVTNDLGVELELYLAGVNNSYAKTFGDRKFYNHRKDTLANEVSVADGSRHEQLVSRMKEVPVIGLHFPNPLQGFSINADREQMSTLPEGFILSGMDTLIAMAMYPDILARDWNTPGLDMAALQWQSAGCSLYFGARGGELGFARTDGLAIALDSSSGGLLFLG